MKRPMPISSWWLQGAILTYLFGFAVLGILAYLTYADQPPIPARFLTHSGQTLFTREDVMDGMHVFQRYGLMEYGTIYGHGAYLGPDFTAQYLHREAESMLAADSKSGSPAPVSQSEIAAELHANTYNAATDSVTFSDARTAAHNEIVDFYLRFFSAERPRAGAQAHWISDAADIQHLTDFFAWTAWTAAANRPGHDYSYTNNWPPEPLAGNSVTADAVTWSVISVIFLLGGMGVVLFFFGRYDWLGWTQAQQRITRIGTPVS